MREIEVFDLILSSGKWRECVDKNDGIKFVKLKFGFECGI